MSKAGESPGSEHWEWVGNELLDAYGRSIAQVRSDVLITGEHRLLIEHNPGPRHFTVRATSHDGKLYRVTQPGFTVSHLSALCNDRPYSLNRTQWWSKQRCITDAAGEEVAVVRPLISGKVQIHDGPAIDHAPELDVVFMTWALVLVDSPVRRTLT